MATIPYVRNTTWADGSGGGTPISAAKLQVIENGIYEVSYAPAVRAFHNANQSITTGTVTALSLNSERFDQAANAADTMHDTVTNNSRLTCKYAGIYKISLSVAWGSSSGGTQRMCGIRHQGSTYLARVSQSVSATALDYQQSVTTEYALAVNEYVEAIVFHDTGSGLNITASGNYSPEFSMVRVG